MVRELLDMIFQLYIKGMFIKTFLLIFSYLQSSANNAINASEFIPLPPQQQLFEFGVKYPV